MYLMPGFFTLGVGACVGVDEITPAKLGSVVLRFAARPLSRRSIALNGECCSVIGVIVVSKSDHDLPSLPSDGGSTDPTLPAAPLLGDALALASALAYAFYVILLKVRIKNEARVSMTLFFGFVRTVQCALRERWLTSLQPGRPVQHLPHLADWSHPALHSDGGVGVAAWREALVEHRHKRRHHLCESSPARVRLRSLHPLLRRSPTSSTSEQCS